MTSEDIYTRLFGIVFGILLLVAAIRWMFGKK